ncbi:MAG: Fic family protein [Deltaproteobacteria bacterium]|nr:Fic family protein [Deltaproteobacteria bacterium]
MRAKQSFTPSQVKLDSTILLLLESISRRQGELSVHKHSIQEELEIESMASVDAVHFSTKLEGNALSHEQVTQALRSQRVRAKARDLKEVLNYARTRRMLRAWSLKDKSFNDDLILRCHSELLKGIVKGRLRGHYRNAQCVITNSRTREIIYLAPVAADVPKLMKGLLSWLRQQQASPLILAAQFHFEFVTIHPFMDGNGRLARLLTNSILLREGYDVERFAALEKQHEYNRSLYYEMLHTHQAANFYDIPLGQNISRWIVYWLECLLRCYDEALSRVRKLPSSVDSSLPPVLEARLKKAEALFRQHVRLRAVEYGDLTGLGRTQAVEDLNKLVKAGILEHVGGGRSTYYRIRKNL